MSDAAGTQGMGKPAGKETPVRALRLLVVDDHEVVRQGLVALLDRRDAFQVVAEAGTVVEALAAVERFVPDLVIMDVRLPDGSGIEACREIRAEHPEIRVVMLTSYPDEEAVLSAIVAGASGYLLKQVRGPALVSAVRTVAAGGSLFEDLGPAARPRRSEDEADGRLDSLTDQERTVLALIGEGLTNRQIGARMGLAEKTVKNYTSHLLAKLGFERRTQAAILATRLRDRPTG